MTPGPTRKAWAPRRRRAWRVVRRSSLMWWTLTAVLALVTALVVGTSVRRTSAAAERLGASRAVWVVRAPVAGGDVFRGSDVSLVARPRGLVPVGALDASASPIGEATRVDVVVGEIVLTGRLAGHGAHGVAAMVPPGYRAVAVPNDEATPRVATGDRVDVLATFDVGDGLSAARDGPATAPSFAVASNAEVLAVSPRAITLAVESADAPRVAFALAKAAVTLALRGPTAASERSQSR